jgi:acyl-CoA thioester hydrolase
MKYLDVYKEGFVIPIVQLHIDFRRPLLYGESAIIETTYVDGAAARIVYNYRIFRESDNELLVTGSSIQAFLTMDRQLVLTIPPFFMEWKKKNGLLS